VVIGSHADEVTAVLPPGLEIIENRDWALTQTRDSLRIGLKGIPPDARVVVTPVDTPPVTARVLDALLAVEGPAVPQHRGQPGHPVVVQAGPARVALANGTLRDHTATAKHISVEEPRVLLGFNTPEEWTAWAGTYSSPRISRS
jgi:CTP:molybdopterin cytidylyltransferase MocA